MNLATVYMWIEKKLPTHKVGRLWKFKASQVEEWVQAGKVAEETKKKWPTDAHSRRREKQSLAADHEQRDRRQDRH